MKGKAAVTILTAVLVLAGTFGLTSALVTLDDDIASLVPSEASLYGHVYLNPSTNQKEALQDLLARFDRGPAGEELTDALSQLFDDGLGQFGLNFADDVRPWLGGQVGGFMSLQVGSAIPETILLVRTRDQSATDKVADAIMGEAGPLERTTYRGYEYQRVDEAASGFVEGFWVMGSEFGFRSVVDTAEDDDLSLAESPAYRDIVAQLPSQRLALVYADVGAMVEASVAVPARLAGAPAAELELMKELRRLAGPTAWSLSLRREGIVLDSATAQASLGPFALSGGFRPQPRLLAGVLGSAWAAFGIPALGETVNGFLDVFGDVAPRVRAETEREFRAATGFDLQKDLLSWAGDARAFVSGTGPLSFAAAVVADSTDPQKSAATVLKLRRRLERLGLQTQTATVGDYRGFSLNLPGTPFPLIVVAADTKLIVAAGRGAAEAAIEPTETLDDSAPFRAASSALGDDYAPVLYLDLDTVVSIADAFARGDADYQTAREWIEPMSQVIAGTKLDDGILLQRIVMGVQTR